jgi:hypothetical protein
MGDAAESIGRAFLRMCRIILQSKGLEIRKMRISPPGVSD